MKSAQCTYTFRSAFYTRKADFFSRLMQTLFHHIVCNFNFYIPLAFSRILNYENVTFLTEVIACFVQLVKFWWFLNIKSLPDQFKDPFMLHRNCVVVPLYRLLSVTSHRSFTAFQVKWNEFNFNVTPQCSDIAISVQDGAVQQSNAIAV